MALLAGAVAGVAAFRMGLPELRSLSLAALLFLIQFGAFVLLSGLGLPASTAQESHLPWGWSPASAVEVGPERSACAPERANRSG